MLGAGADFVMMGGMFAGHDQSGEKCLIFIDNKYYVLIMHKVMSFTVSTFILRCLN